MPTKDPQKLKEQQKRKLQKRKERRAVDPAYNQKILEKQRARYKANPDRQRRGTKVYAEKHPDKFKEYNRQKARRFRLKHKYKITQEEFDALFLSQGNVCAICKIDAPRNSRDWHIDHCHDTGKVRGVLCHVCNTCLVRSDVSPDMLREAASYLER